MGSPQRCFEDPISSCLCMTFTMWVMWIGLSSTNFNITFAFFQRKSLLWHTPTTYFCKDVDHSIRISQSELVGDSSFWMWNIERSLYIDELCHVILMDGVDLDQPSSELCIFSNVNNLSSTPLPTLEPYVVTDIILYSFSYFILNLVMLIEPAFYKIMENIDIFILILSFLIIIPTLFLWIPHTRWVYGVSNVHTSCREGFHYAEN